MFRILCIVVNNAVLYNIISFEERSQMILFPRHLVTFCLNRGYLYAISECVTLPYASHPRRYSEKHIMQFHFL